MAWIDVEEQNNKNDRSIMARTINDALLNECRVRKLLLIVMLSVYIPVHILKLNTVRFLGDELNMKQENQDCQEVPKIAPFFL